MSQTDCFFTFLSLSLLLPDILHISSQIFTNPLNFQTLNLERPTFLQLSRRAN